MRQAVPLTAVLRAQVRAAATAAERESAIDAWLRETAAQSGPRVVLVEGQVLAGEGPGGVPLVGLGAGCPCCTGLVSLRVVLGRTLRAMRPDAVLLLAASAEHLPRLRRLLESGELGAPFEIED